MKKITNLLVRLKALTNAVSRFVVTLVFTISATVLLAVSIQKEQGYTKLLLTCAVGALLCAALQTVYERFFKKTIIRIVLMACGILLTVLYYMTIMQVSEISMEIGVRTAVALFSLFIAFMWCPVIKSKITFNDSFIAVFKAFFHTALYASVAFMGCNLIIATTNVLIFHVSEKAFPQTANIIYVLLSPIFFLSLIPIYPGNKSQESNEKIEADDTQTTFMQHAISIPKFLAVLIEFIIIPLASVFTIILVIYILMNIRGEFWTNNLLEPMLVSYAITVILVYILSSRLENRIAVLFRKIFPKILVPIVLFQIAASILTLGDTGITHTRYFVILFGIFAASAGIVMCILPVKKNGVIAAMFLVFAFISMVPPIDAFSVSRASQKNILEKVLTRNQMLMNGIITPNANISDDDKEIIASSVLYLERMDYIEDVDWIPANFRSYENFTDVFGFEQYTNRKPEYSSINVFTDSKKALDISGYDFFIQTFVSDSDGKEGNLSTLEYAGKSYTIKKIESNDMPQIILSDSDDNEIIHFNTDEIFERYSKNAIEKSAISYEEAKFSTENSKVKMTIIVNSVYMEKTYNSNYYSAEFYILISFK